MRFQTIGIKFWRLFLENRIHKEREEFLLLISNEVEGQYFDMTRSVVALQNAEPGHWHGNAERVGGRKEMKRKI
jgi:hypothetical protein